MKGRWTSIRWLPLWVVVAALAGGFYLLVAAGQGATGFPLDDAWIHQTYARNLAGSGQWSFVLGQPSAGSTAPLWSLLLSLGYWLGIPPLAWAFGLGVLGLGLTGWTLARVGQQLYPDRLWIGWLAGLLCLLEWHMVWAAVSGMETVLFTWLAASLVWFWLRIAPATRAVPANFLVLGLLGGLLALTRPEGLGLVGLIGLALGCQLRQQPRRWLTSWALMGLGLAIPLLPYLLFHYNMTGLPFPNTFYAKQQEYRALLELYPLWRRWLMVAGVTLVGGQVLLLPGILYEAGRALLGAFHKGETGDKNHSSTRIGVLVMAGWCALHLGIYALRLPVSYQHGRYQMPVIPFLLLLGVAGTVHLLDLIRHPMWGRVLRRAVAAACGLIFLAFLVIGARAYAADVGFIQGEMVATARWLEANTTPQDLIAVHDIGAVGYFTPRPLLDLAGLVTPEVIPFIDDQEQLVEFMQARGADYVIFFPDWSDAYRAMAGDPRLELLHSSGYQWTRQQGGANMSVYRLQQP